MQVLKQQQTLSPLRIASISTGKSRSQRSDNQLLRKVTVFARQLMRYETELSFSEIMWYAWDEMHKFGHNYELVKFTKVDGTIAQRIILSCKWSDMNTVTGTGRRLSPGRVLFMDAAKVHQGQKGTISTYDNLIIERF